MHIIVYTKTGCGWADEVKDFLHEHALSFEEREMLLNPAYKEEAIQKSGQWMSPTLDIDGDILPDSDKDQVEAYLLKKGLLPSV